MSTVTKFFSKIAGNKKNELIPIDIKTGIDNFKIDLKFNLLFFNNISISKE
mgnify:CR=1 FL=1